MCKESAFLKSVLKLKLTKGKLFVKEKQKENN